MPIGIVRQLEWSDAVTMQVARVLDAARRCAGVHPSHVIAEGDDGAFQYRLARAWQRVDDRVEVEPWFLRDADACGAGHAEAAQRSCAALRFAGDAIMTDTAAFCAALGRS